MIRQWNGLGGEMRFLAGDETQLLPFSRIKPWVRRRRRWGNRLSGQERWSWGSEKKREGLASKVGVKKKQPFLERRAYFFLEEQVSSKKIGFLSWNFLLPHHFLMPTDAAKSILLQHNKKHHFPSSTFAFWEISGSTKQASKDGGMSTLKSTEGPSACMSINVPHDWQDRHDRRQTSNSYSLFLSWQPSPSVLTASKSCTNISATSVNFICTENAQWGT